jgi:hypothetical protein
MVEVLSTLALFLKHLEIHIKIHCDGCNRWYFVAAFDRPVYVGESTNTYP